MKTHIKLILCCLFVWMTGGSTTAGTSDADSSERVSKPSERASRPSEETIHELCLRIEVSLHKL